MGMMMPVTVFPNHHLAYISLKPYNDSCIEIIILHVHVYTVIGLLMLSLLGLRVDPLDVVKSTGTSHSNLSL